MKEKRLLFIWPVHRADWVQPLRHLEKDFQLTFLAGIFPPEHNEVEEFADVYCWSEFSNAQSILDRLKPHCLIFMSIDNGLSMVLNYIAKSQGIPTYILQHGIYTNYRDYRNREKLWRKRELARKAQSQKRVGNFSTSGFSFTSLKGTSKLWLGAIFLYTMATKYIGPYWAAKNIPLPIKRAQKYLCFTRYNAAIHKETDRIGPDDIIYIGSTELQAYLGQESDLIDETFYLHIDQALAENSFGEETVSKESMIEFYHKLNEYCLEKRAKLYIKLHPESYNSDWLPRHENINYLRRVDNFNRFIQSAQGCFGFYSTMIIPAVYWKPTVLFEIQYSGLVDAISSMKAASILDFWKFEVADISFVNSDHKEEIREKFILSKEAGLQTLTGILNEN